jgi:hypothetical protein
MALTVADLGSLGPNHPDGPRVLSQVLTVLGGTFDRACLTISQERIEEACHAILREPAHTQAWRDALRAALMIAIEVQKCLLRQDIDNPVVVPPVPRKR